jgi:hypothetical protein
VIELRHQHRFWCGRSPQSEPKAEGVAVGLNSEADRPEFYEALATVNSEMENFCLDGLEAPLQGLFAANSIG